jgi:hypothetical protein
MAHRSAGWTQHLSTSKDGDEGRPIPGNISDIDGCCNSADYFFFDSLFPEEKQKTDVV